MLVEILAWVLWFQCTLKLAAGAAGITDTTADGLFGTAVATMVSQPAHRLPWLVSLPGPGAAASCCYIQGNQSGLSLVLLVC